MNSARPSLAKGPRLTDRRLQRLSLWLALMIVWFAAHVLGRVSPEKAARLLAQHARDARMLLVARAVKRLDYQAPRLSGRIERRRLTIRAVAGAALRRALPQPSLAGRARALCAALANADHWIARIIERLNRGFTKLCCLPKRAAALSEGFAPRLRKSATSRARHFIDVHCPDGHRRPPPLAGPVDYVVSVSNIPK
jgi:hypothetical protein